MFELLDNNPFIEIVSKATDENPFADNKIRFRTPKEVAEYVVEHFDEIKAELATFGVDITNINEDEEE